MPFIISRTNRSISREQEKQLKARLGKAICLVPGITPDRIYIRYSDIPDWGVAGHNFDRNKYL